MEIEKLRELLAEFKGGAIDEDELLSRLKYMPFEDIGYAKVDHHRSLRTGFPEVIYGAGKTTEQIIGISATIVERNTNLLVTRISDEAAEALTKTYPSGTFNSDARVFFLEFGSKKKAGDVLVVTAGTTDIPVAEEAAVTASLFGCNVSRIYDVGVAGVHRLMAHKDLIEAADVLIVAAGMEGALASVVASMVEVPVIALPTSVGYGASFGGLAALLGMMTSCASGVSVVNIDNGFGAGCTAALIVRRAVHLADRMHREAQRKEEK